MTRTSPPIDAGRLEPDLSAGEGAPPRLVGHGSWTVAAAVALEHSLDHVPAPAGGRVEIDLSAIRALDTAGAHLLAATLRRLEEGGVRVELTGLSAERRALLAAVAEHGGPAPQAPGEPGGVLAVLEQVGRGSVEVAHQSVGFVAFLGHAVATAGRVLVRPRRLRWTALVFHMEAAGLNALPIVGLISFLIGVVLAYQGAVQLRQFGADVFVVDLIGIAVLREFGILLAAIMVAGRSGSAFTAELGAMKLDEEVDALRTLGLDPMEVLVMPRVAALVVTLPLLTLFADLMGILGGGLMSWASLGLAPRPFLERLGEVVTLESFLVGLVKAPVFAAVIGLVGCNQGLAVAGSSESLGRNTTRSVVQSIFLVIVLDAFFSIFFNYLGI